MNLQTLQTNNKTMSSREIAQLCNKRHDHVCRDIELVNKDYEKEGLPKIGDTYYFNEQNGQKYLQYELTEMQCLDLVSGYSRPLRFRINRRWVELEREAANSAMKLPDFTNPVEAARAFADQYEAKQIAQEQVALLQPKAAALDVIDCAMGSLNVRDTAKALGIPQNKFVNWCLSHDWMYRDKRNKLKMSSIRMKQGFMEERAVTYQGNSNERVATTQPLFTPKGLTHLAKTFAIVHEVA